jgi:hypothetical protein
MTCVNTKLTSASEVNLLVYRDDGWTTAETCVGLKCNKSTQTAFVGYNTANINTLCGQNVEFLIAKPGGT